MEIHRHHSCGEETHLLYMKDILDIPTYTVTTSVWHRDILRHEPRIFFSSINFIEYIRSYKYIDVLSYSVSTGCIRPLENIRRLILGLPNSASYPAKEVRIIPNNHSKVFICHFTRSKYAVFIGSQNLTHGANLNLMMRVPNKDRSIFQNYFEKLWTAAS